MYIEFQYTSKVNGHGIAFKSFLREQVIVQGISMCMIYDYKTTMDKEQQCRSVVVMQIEQYRREESGNIIIKQK